MFGREIEGGTDRQAAKEGENHPRSSRCSVLPEWCGHGMMHKSILILFHSKGQTVESKLVS